MPILSRRGNFDMQNVKNEVQTDTNLFSALSEQAEAALQRLASCYAITEAEIMERFLLDAECRTIEAAAFLLTGKACYYAMELKLGSAERLSEA